MATNSRQKVRYDAISDLVDRLGERHAQYCEQRSCERYPFNVPVSVCTPSAGGRMTEVCAAWALDISHEGISLLAPGNLHVYKTLYLNFESVIGRPTLIQIRQVYAEKLIKGICRIGVRFVTSDTEEAEVSEGGDGELAEEGTAAQAAALAKERDELRAELQATQEAQETARAESEALKESVAELRALVAGESDEQNTSPSDGPSEASVDESGTEVETDEEPSAAGQDDPKADGPA